MFFQDIICNKRDGKELTNEEISFFVKGAANGEIPDYQLSAMLMAIFLKGMSKKETLTLTMEMAASGEQCDLSDIKGVTVDKHSSGGVADTVTLVLAPMLAACGAVVAKMSGRGLGFSGGTIDKLESIPHMQLDLPMERFKKQANDIGICIAGQSVSLAPADKVLYALRDATATVASIPLIASSIMSKKLAAGAKCIMLDVKCGSGAFMKDKESALELAKTMVEIGKGAGRKIAAVVTDMNAPLGQSIGNSLELIEAIETLKGKAGGRLLELCLFLGAKLLILAGLCSTEQEAAFMLKNSIKNGSALSKLRLMIQAQGGDSRVLEDYSLLPASPLCFEIKAKNEGYITHIQADMLGNAALHLGAGRRTKGDKIDYGAGIVLLVKIGDLVKTGQSLAKVYSNARAEFGEAERLIINAIEIGANNPDTKPLYYFYID